MTQESNESAEKCLADIERKFFETKSFFTSDDVTVLKCAKAGVRDMMKSLGFLAQILDGEITLLGG